MRYVYPTFQAVLLGLLVATLPAAGQQPTPLPPVDVTAPTPTTTAPTPPPEEPQAPQTPSRIEQSIFQGSPLFQPNSTSKSMTGAPLDTANSSRSVTTLNQAQISEKAAGATPQILENIPGVLIQRTNQGGGSLIIRGRNGNQNLIMVDGIPINDAGWRFQNVQYLNLIDPGVIERIEVIKGPASVLYGSGALGGVLNIITKSRQNFSQTIDADLGFITSYSTALHDPYNRVEVQGNIRNFGWYMGGSYFAPGAVDAGNGISFPQFATAYDQIAGDMRLDWRVNDYSTLTFVYQHLFQNDVPRTDRFSLPQVDPYRFENRPTFTSQSHDLGYLRYSLFDENAAWISGLELTAWLQRRDEREDELRIQERSPVNTAGPLIQTALRARYRSETVHYGGFDARAFTNFNPGHTLAYGVQYSLNTIDSSQVQQQALAATPFVVLNRPFTVLSPTLPNDGMYHELGFYVMDRLEVTDWLALNAGARYDTISAQGTARANNLPSAGAPTVFDRGFRNWAWEVGSVVRVNDSLNWVADIAQGFRAPNLEDLGANERATAVGLESGNTLLTTEYNIAYETGFKYRGTRLAGDITGYYTNYPNQIVRTLTPVVPTNTRTNSQGYIYGTELQAQYLLTDNLALYGNFSYTFGNDISNVIPAFPGVVGAPQFSTVGGPLRVPPTFGIVGIRYTQRRETYGFFVEGWAEMMGPFDRLGIFDKTDIRVPLGGEAAWETLNLRTGVTTDNYGKLSLGLLNLTNTNYRILGSGVDAPGFELRLGYDKAF